MLYGTIGTTVSQGSEVGNYITGDSYATDDDVTFSIFQQTVLILKSLVLMAYFN